MRKVTWCLGKYSGAMKVRDFVVGKGGGGGEWVGEEGWRAGTLRAKLPIWADDGGLLLYPEDGVCVQRLPVGPKGTEGSDRWSWRGGGLGNPLSGEFPGSLENACAHFVS